MLVAEVLDEDRTLEAFVAHLGEVRYRQLVAIWDAAMYLDDDFERRARNAGYKVENIRWFILLKGYNYDK